MIPAPLLRASADRTFSASDYAVLIFCSSCLTFDYPRPLKLEKIERETGLDLSTIGRAVTRLLRRGYLVERQPDGRVRRFRLSNPRLQDSNLQSA